MSVFDFIKGELLEIIEWTDDSRDTLSYRFPDDDKAIKNGAQLIVRESQLVQFVYLGEFGDTFAPGKHSLTTDNIPILTRLKSWKYGFNSPFKADVYYLTTRLFTANKWGTANPIMLRDDDFGIVRARAFGTYDFKIIDPKLFLKEVAGSDHNFRLDEFAETMRSRVVSIFSDALASAKIPVLDVASRYTELGEALLPLINPVISSKYGIQLGSFIVENVSVPPEVEAAIDKKSSMAAIGNLNDFVKYQMAKGMEQPGGGGAAGTASELAVGFAIAQQIMQQHNMGNLQVPGATPAAAAGAAAAAAAPGLPELLAPADVAKAIGVPEADVMTIIESGELGAKKIGIELSRHTRRTRKVSGELTSASRLPGAWCRRAVPGDLVPRASWPPDAAFGTAAQRHLHSAPSTRQSSIQPAMSIRLRHRHSPNSLARPAARRPSGIRARKSSCARSAAPSRPIRSIASRARSRSWIWSRRCASCLTISGAGRRRSEACSARAAAR